MRSPASQPRCSCGASSSKLPTTRRCSPTRSLATRSRSRLLERVLERAAIPPPAGQSRLRLVDATRLEPATIMPPYYRVDGLTRVGSAWLGRPMLTAQQVEDVVAFLTTLRD